MARGRSKGTVQRVTKRDGEFMKAIAQTSLVTKQNAKDYFLLNDKRLKQLEKSKMVYSQNVYTKNGIQTIYRINSMGRNWLRENTLIRYFQKSDITQINHDITLSQYYCQCDENLRSGWINETTIQQEWNSFSEEERVGATDAMIITQNSEGIDVKICIEVITSNYGQQELVEKQDVAEKLGAQIYFIKS